jgi:cell division protease FtsH
LKEKIAELLAGRVAEAIVFGDISGGASNDIQRATETARKMVTQLCMSDVLGPVLYGSGHGEVFLGRDFSNSKDYSEEVAAKIDAEIKALLDEGYAKAKEILEQKRDKLDFIAEFLLMYEVMDGDQFAAAMDKDATARELVEMAEEKKRLSKSENEAKARENDTDSEAEKPATQEADALSAPESAEKEADAPASNEQDNGDNGQA